MEVIANASSPISERQAAPSTSSPPTCNRKAPNHSTTHGANSSKRSRAKAKSSREPPDRSVFDETRSVCSFGQSFSAGVESVEAFGSSTAGEDLDSRSPML